MKKLLLITILMLQVNQVYAHTSPVFLDIAKNADGTVKLMDQVSALEYCKNSANVQQPAHLPSVRELAYLSMQLGAKVLDIDLDYINRKVPSEYYVVNVFNDDGSTGAFYYSHAGFQTSPEFNNNWFWSASADPTFPKDSVAYALNGQNGYITPDGLWEKLAVRCVQGN